MSLDDFISMWQEDGTKLLEQDRRVVNGSIWLLYAVYFPYSTDLYGRHMAMILKVDAITHVILKHDLKNIAGEDESNWRKTILAWFNSHVDQY